MIKSIRVVSTVSTICVRIGSIWFIRSIITGRIAPISSTSTGITAEAICAKAERTVAAVCWISGISWLIICMIPAPSSEKLACSSAQIAVTLARKSSFVCHKYIKPAASAATIAITAMTGPETAPRAVVNPVIAPFIFPNCATREPQFIATKTALSVPNARPISGR